MDLFLLFSFTHENNEIKSPTKIYDFTVVQIMDFLEFLHENCKGKSETFTEF